MGGENAIVNLHGTIGGDVYNEGGTLNPKGTQLP